MTDFSYPDEINTILAEARATRSGDKARSLLDRALRLCDGWKNSAPVEATIGKAKIYAELAEEGINIPQRQLAWKTALQTLSVELNREPNADIANAYSEISVNCDHDALSGLDLTSRRKNLISSLKYLEQIMPGSTETVQADLLVRRSSVLRRLSQSEVSKILQERRASEAKRCIEKASRVLQGLSYPYRTSSC
jgi:hypothetical protein